MYNNINIEFKNSFNIGFLLVFSALLLATIVDQSLNKQIETIIQSPTGLSNSIFIWGAMSLISSLFFPLLVSLLCCHTLAGVTIKRRLFLKEKMELGIIETLRAWGKTFLWCFAFIIPGLIKYTYYLLTPFVVFFSKNYALGKVDALEHSEMISKKFWWRLNIWITLFYMIIPLIISSVLDEKRSFRLNPVLATLCVVMETAIVFIFHYIMLKLFIKYLNEVENKAESANNPGESHVAII